jgi:hypothetical protein
MATLAKRLLAVAIIGVALAGIVFAVVWVRRNKPEPETVTVGPLEDPRLTYTGPYRNVRPDVKYVGDAACVKCHKDETATYKHHPMARSTIAIGDLNQPLDKKHNNPFVHDGVTFEVFKEGNRFFHRRRRFDDAGKLLYEFKQEVHYAIGSGAMGYSYLSRTDDGFVFQTPISWYSQKQQWNLSPGMDQGGVKPRVVHGYCLNCHANRVLFREDSINRYDEPIFQGLGIGCERCHGPGELHVRSKDRLDIVNPRRLEPALREAICQQCHLEGHPRMLHRGRKADEFRPGLPIEAFWSIFIETEQNGEPKAVSQVEQMYQSLCFQRGTEEHRLGCVTCHNPHEVVVPADRLSHYNGRCIECHHDKPCTESKARQHEKNDSCIDCHMTHRGSEDIPHTAFTDHRIARRPGQTSRRGSLFAPAHLGAAQRGLLMRVFRPAGIDFDQDETARDLGLAIVFTSNQASNQDPTLSKLFTASLLNDALKRDPGDVDARLWRSTFLERVLEDYKGALADADAALEVRPLWEPALARAGGLAQRLEQIDRAIDYYRRAAAVNPWWSGYHRQLATLFAARGDWKEAWPELQLWMQLEPESIDARAHAIGCLVHLGRKAEAEAEFQKIVAFRPANLAELRTWYADQLR